MTIPELPPIKQEEGMEDNDADECQYVGVVHVSKRRISHRPSEFSPREPPQKISKVIDSSHNPPQASSSRDTNIPERRLSNYNSRQFAGSSTDDNSQNIQRSDNIFTDIDRSRSHQYDHHMSESERFNALTQEMRYHLTQDKPNRRMVVRNLMLCNTGDGTVQGPWYELERISTEGTFIRWGFFHRASIFRREENNYLVQRLFEVPQRFIDVVSRVEITQEVYIPILEQLLFTPLLYWVMSFVRPSALMAICRLRAHPSSSSIADCGVCGCILDLYRPRMQRNASPKRQEHVTEDKRFTCRGCRRSMTLPRHLFQIVKHIR